MNATKIAAGHDSPGTPRVEGGAVSLSVCRDNATLTPAGAYWLGQLGDDLTAHRDTCAACSATSRRNMTKLCPGARAIRDAAIAAQVERDTLAGAEARARLAGYPECPPWCTITHDVADALGADPVRFHERRLPLTRDDERGVLLERLDHPGERGMSQILITGEPRYTVTEAVALAALLDTAAQLREREERQMEWCSLLVQRMQEHEARCDSCRPDGAGCPGPTVPAAPACAT